MEADYARLMKRYNNDDIGGIIRNAVKDMKNDMRVIAGKLKKASDEFGSGEKGFARKYISELKNRTPDSLGFISYTNHWGASVEIFLAGMSDSKFLLARGGYMALTYFAMPFMASGRELTYDVGEVEKDAISDEWSLGDSVYTFATTLPFKLAFYEAAARISPEPYDSGEVWTATIVLSMIAAGLGGRAYRTGDIFRAGYGDNDLDEEVRVMARKRSMRMAGISALATAALYLGPNPGVDIFEKFFEDPEPKVENVTGKVWRISDETPCLEDIMEYRF